MMAGRSVYLDYNATSPLRPAARAATIEAFDEFGNASSVHAFGRAARRRVEEAREAVAALVGAEPAAVTFTSGGTEANNLALSQGASKPILASAGEHPSVLSAAEAIQPVPLRPSGQIDVAALESALAEVGPGCLVTVMRANNETGVIQPLDQVVDCARRFGALVHCDAVQAPGRLNLDMTDLGVDFLSLSAHKIGGPQGAGALVARQGIGLSPLLRGGGQERGRRAGTENVAAIAGFGAAVRAVAEEPSASVQLAAWRDTLEARLKAMAPDVIIIGEESERLANTCCFALPGLSAETQVMALDLEGVAVSAGSACSSGKVKTSHVLKAMGFDDRVSGSAIRVSLGWQSRAEDIDALLEAWGKLYRRWLAAA